VTSFDFEVDQGSNVAWRVRVPSGLTHLDDMFVGRQEFDVQADVGDFLVATKMGLPSYQLAVVVDDVSQGVTDVVRGDDLLSSTPRQQLLYDLLRATRITRYWHVPLVVGPDGRRLAKRHGDSRIDRYRQAGVRAARIIGLIADWCGVEVRQEMDAAEFCERFDVGRIPRQPVVFTQADHEWLLSKP
jgi:glutamyl-tRNA synthetase